MSFRARTSVITATAAAFVALLAPIALAASHGPVQVTGKQLKSALLPTADFGSGFTVVYSANSGSKLERRGVFKLPSMSCKVFWPSAGVTAGFGETAFATDLTGPKTVSLSSNFELFNQTVYQFASTKTATAFLSQLTAKYHSCRSASASDTKGGTLHWTTHSQSKSRVGGHPALQVVEYLSDAKVSAPPTMTDLLWTVDSTDIYMISTQLLSGESPQPTQASLTLKLIARVTKLR